MCVVWWGWWCETPSCPLWRHRNVCDIVQFFGLPCLQYGEVGDVRRHRAHYDVTVMCVTLCSFPAFHVCSMVRLVMWDAIVPIMTSPLCVWHCAVFRPSMPAVWWGWWCETPSCLLWRHRNVCDIVQFSGLPCVEYAASLIRQGSVLIPLTTHWGPCMASYASVMRGLGGAVLTHWGRHKMTTIFQTKFSNASPWIKLVLFWSKFQWNLFPGV